MFKRLLVNQTEKSKFHSILRCQVKLIRLLFSFFDTNSTGALYPMVTYMQLIHNIWLKIIEKIKTLFFTDI